jgi:hypothetical protein
MLKLQLYLYTKYLFTSRKSNLAINGDLDEGFCGYSFTSPFGNVISIVEIEEEEETIKSI